MDSFELAFALVPGIILFLYGIDHFSKEIERIAGERFRSMLAKVTRTRIGGALLGALVTATVQSSTATTVIVVSLVGAGIIPFMQSVSVIIGANVGTTVTGQLIALKLTAFAPIFILLGFLLSLFGRNYKFLGKPIFYFGLVFFGLTLISNTIEPYTENPMIVGIFSQFSNVLLAIAAGFLVTVLMQSSSVTTGLVVLLVGNGLLSLEQGIPLIMGANIGTTLTSLLASLNMDLFAKRAATAHFLFNLSGVLLFLPFLHQFAMLVSSFGGAAAQQMANAHTLFNVFAALIFLTALKPFTAAVERLVPGKEEEVVFRTKFLNDKLPESNEVAFILIGKEIQHSLDVTLKQFRYAMEMFRDGDESLLMKVSKLESFNDFLDQKISTALSEFSPRKLSKEEASKALLLIRMSNAAEQIGDIAKSLAFLGVTMKERGLKLRQESVSDLDLVYGQFEKNLILMSVNVPLLNAQDREKIRGNDVILRDLITDQYKDHLPMISSSSFAATSFVDALSLIESSNSKVREIRKLAEEYSKL